ncbi:hypothetical protein, partial [Roseibium album]|uniref:hypothetical protein n=1 Tax=Roseibium album TaxID=311410 RepID=UPI00391A1823
RAPSYSGVGASGKPGAVHNDEPKTFSGVFLGGSTTSAQSNRNPIPLEELRKVQMKANPQIELTEPPTTDFLLNKILRRSILRPIA